MATTKVIDHLNYGEDTYYFGLAKESYIKEPRVRNASFEITQNSGGQSVYACLASDTNIKERITYILNLFVNTRFNNHTRDLFTSMIIDVVPSDTNNHISYSVDSSLKCSNNNIFPYQDLYLAIQEVPATVENPTVTYNWYLLIDRSNSRWSNANMSLQILNCPSTTFSFPDNINSNTYGSVIGHPELITINSSQFPYALIQCNSFMALGENLQPISSSSYSGDTIPLLCGKYNSTTLGGVANPLVVVGNGDASNRKNLAILTDTGISIKEDNFNIDLLSTNVQAEDVAIGIDNLTINTNKNLVFDADEAVSIAAKRGRLELSCYREIVLTTNNTMTDRDYFSHPIILNESSKINGNLMVQQNAAVKKLLTIDKDSSAFNSNEVHGIHIGQVEENFDGLNTTPFIISKKEGTTVTTLAYINDNGNGFINNQWHVKGKLVVGNYAISANAASYSAESVGHPTVQTYGHVQFNNGQLTINGREINGRDQSILINENGGGDINLNGGHLLGAGADYAEFVKEWYDGNPYQEDRYGYMVTVKDGLLYKANENDHVIGITSKNPLIIGNNNKNLNQRIDKKWSCVGMRGVIPVYDDGSCVAGCFCKCGKEGVATYAEKQDFDTYFVIERLSSNMVSVEVK